MHRESGAPERGRRPPSFSVARDSVDQCDSFCAVTSPATFPVGHARRIACCSLGIDRVPRTVQVLRGRVVSPRHARFPSTHVGSWCSLAPGRKPGMLNATRELTLPTTVTGSWPRPSWFTEVLRGRAFKDALGDSR